jgi:FAD/FMN-containing dehydrogenase
VTTSPMLQDRVTSELRRSIEPHRVVTSGPDYEASCAVWNGAVTHRPEVLVRCASPADAQAAVGVAREFDVPLSVRGGGHDWAGRALVDRGVTIDLSSMRRVTVEPEAAVARLQGGATGADVVAAAQPFGLTAVTGTVGAVGMVGLSLGGGYGPSTGRFGLGVDNVVSVDVVLADGTMVTVDAEHEPDLFWALRGGGGNFGVVTSMRIRLHAVPTIVAGMIMFPWVQAASVLEALGDSLLGGPDELTVQCGILTGPTGQPVVFVAPAWCGDPDPGTRVVERLAELGTPLVSQMQRITEAELLAQTDGLFPNRRHVEIRPRTVAALTRKVVDVLCAAGDDMTSPLSAVSLHSLHGAAARVPVADTAFGVRTAHIVVENIAIWEPGDTAAATHRAWARELSDALTKCALPGGYANLLGPDEPAQIAHAYGPNADRLLAIKQRYDPDSTFSAIPLPPAKREA